MSVVNAITSLKAIVPLTAADARAFLEVLPTDIQDQLIAALYLGREHIHCSKLRDDIEMSRLYTDHISRDEYANVLSEKGTNVATYLNKLEECASASGFDLEML